MTGQWNRVGGASRPRPPTPPYVFAVYGGFFNVVTRHTCGQRCETLGSETSPWTSLGAPGGPGRDATRLCPRKPGDVRTTAKPAVVLSNRPAIRPNSRLGP